MAGCVFERTSDEFSNTSSKGLGSLSGFKNLERLDLERDVKIWMMQCYECAKVIRRSKYCTNFKKRIICHLIRSFPRDGRDGKSPAGWGAMRDKKYPGCSHSQPYCIVLNLSLRVFKMVPSRSSIVLTKSFQSCEPSFPRRSALSARFGRLVRRMDCRKRLRTSEIGSKPNLKLRRESGK